MHRSPVLHPVKATDTQALRAQDSQAGILGISPVGAIHRWRTMDAGRLHRQVLGILHRTREKCNCEMVGTHGILEIHEIQET
jgi:hypothetical protein